MRFGLAACTLVSLLGVACGHASDPEPRGVRIVLVTLDTLRADALPSMPKLASRAASARRFTNAFASSPATQPSHASLFTGLAPWEHGVSRNGLVLAEARLTLAERLADAGFATAAVVASFPLHPRFGFAQGFDVFVHRFGRRLGGETWKGAAVAGRFYQTAGPVTEDALRLLREASGVKQFFWFHYFDPHEPYGDTVGEGMPLGVLAATRRDAPERLPARIEAAHRLYGRDVAHLDRQLDRVFQQLEVDAARFETHVLVTADHGESFGEDGALGHGARLTREQVQVPLLVWSPDVTAGVDAAPASSVDVARTLLARAGVDPRGFGGRDLGGPAPREGARATGMRVTGLGPLDLLLAGLPPDASRAPRFFLADGTRLYAGDGHALFEEDDPARPVRDDPLRARFAGFAAALARTAAVERLDPETREGLRALGYGE